MGPATPLILCFSDQRFRFGVLVFIFFGLWVRLFFRSEAKMFCSLWFCPSRPDPFENCCCLFFFSCCVVVFWSPSSRSLPLLSRRWENTNRVAVCGFPCVSSSWTRPPPSTRTPSSTTTSRSTPAPVVFFSLVVVPVVVGLGLFWLWRASLSTSPCCLACAALKRQRGWPTRRRPHL